MSRRRSRNTPPPEPFAGTDLSINQMERAVIYRTVDRDLFNAGDILDWMITAEAMRCLRAAYPHTQNTSGSWDGNFAMDGERVHINIATSEIACLAPHDVVWDGTSVHFQDTTKGPAIYAALKDMRVIVENHNVIRRVVTWFNDNKVTPGFARHYFPALGSLLHADHAFHQVDGTRFADRVMPHEIATDLRRAPEVIAAGLFCRPSDHGTLDGRAYCTVTFEDGQGIPLFAKAK